MKYRDEFDEVLAYIKRMGTHPFLNKEIQKELILKGKENDNDSRSKLIQAGIGLVIKKAKQYRDVAGSLRLLDLCQEGIIGMIMAIDHYEPEKGLSFFRYAEWWIKSYMLQAINVNSRTVRISIHRIVAIIRYGRLKHQLSQSLGHEATLEEMAEAMELPLKQIEKIHQDVKAREHISLNTPFNKGNQDSETFEKFIADHKNPTPEQTVQLSDIKRKTYELLALLTPKEEKVLRMRFGIGEKYDHTLEEVSLELGVTRERIRQIQEKAIKKSRVNIQKMNSDDFF